MNDPASDHELRNKIAALPRELTPSRDLWSGIRAGIANTEQFPPAECSAEVARLGPKAPSLFRRFAVPLALAATVTLASILFWPRSRPAPAAPGWSIASLSGSPRVGSTQLTGRGEWRAGDWLETDAVSRAQLDIGNIGEVRLEPNSRLRLVSTAADDHRLELARGSLSAFIWAPPRLFFVETPSATAIDLGCAYTLEVDDHGAGSLHVTSGYVALAHGGRESIIPAGLMCVTRPGVGPGTPFAANAPAPFRAALERFDFAAGGDAALDAVVTAATANDKITLWHLLTRAPTSKRGSVFDRLALHSPPPMGVTREGILAGDPLMRDRWALDLGLVTIGSRTKKKL